MATAPTLTWEQYQQLPPDKRSRPLTPAEYAALTRPQRQAAGVEDSDAGAPANFNGPVFPNPDHVQPQLDTDSAIPAMRLPQGVSAQTGNTQGQPTMDVSNPAAADVVPPVGRTIGADFSPAQSKPMSTVPIFAPDGSIGDIPSEQLASAVKGGAKPGIHITAPDGSPGVVPADRLQDAVKAGARIIPIEDQPVQHPGFWASMGADLGGMAKGLWHGATDPLTDTHEDLVRKLHEEQASDAAANNSPERKAHGSLYRNVTVPLAEVVGVNVPGMEQSAAEGDVAGVYGHAAAPIAAAAVAKGVEGTAGALSEAADTAAGQGVKAGVKAAAKKLPVAAIRRIPYVGDVAADVYKAGTEAAAKAKGVTAPELDATAENKSFAGGADEPPPQKVLDATGENKPFAGGMDEPAPPKKPAQRAAATAKPAPRTVVVDPETGAREFSDVVAQKQQAAQVTPQSKVAQPAATVPSTPEPSTDPVLSRLREFAAKNAADEASASAARVPGPEEDMTAPLQQMLDEVLKKKAAGIKPMLNRLARGEAGQAGAPGSVTDADEGIADIQNRPVAATKTGQVPARGFLQKVGADENSVLKTQGDLDSVFYHRQQIAKNGIPNVELHLDGDNNIIGAQGRHRALAAIQQGGPKANVNLTIYKHASEAPE